MSFARADEKMINDAYLVCNFPYAQHYAVLHFVVLFLCETAATAAELHGQYLSCGNNTAAVALPRRVSLLRSRHVDLDALGIQVVHKFI